MGLVKLAIECFKKNWSVSDKKIPDVKVVYKVETDTDILYFWNSSNNGKIDIGEVLFKIGECLEKWQTEGSVMDDFNEIMFETYEK